MSQPEHFARVAARYDEVRPRPTSGPLGEAMAGEGNRGSFRK
jgi:hypothetical protein